MNRYTLEEARADVLAILDDEGLNTKDSTKRRTILVPVEGTDRSVAIELPDRRTWGYRRTRDDEPEEVDRILVKAGDCLDFSSRYGSKAKTRTIPALDTKAGRPNVKTLRKAIVESVEMVRDDEERRAARTAERDARDAERTAVRDALHERYPGLFTPSWEDGPLPFDGSLPILGITDANLDVSLDERGRVSIKMRYLSTEEAQSILDVLASTREERDVE
jgi:hypothetical protein